MEKSLVTLDKGTCCSSWNYCCQRLATGSSDGILAIFDSPDPDSSTFTCTSRCKAHETSITKVTWIPPEYGDAVACICLDGKLSLWEEIEEGPHPLKWKVCKHFESNAARVLDLQFGMSQTSLKMVVAYSDGQVKIYELLDPLELKKWQLQVWEFDEAHQRWLPVAELALPEDKGDQVYVVAWAPNIGRPYEMVAVATSKGIVLWHLGLNPDADGRLPVEKVALLSGHEGEVWQMEWDMSGMTLATTGSDGVVRLWQSNLNGVWHEEAAFRAPS
ncbi:PREDICTED: protein SEH1-like isoform X2 [Nelumbo nucifera]|uniref:Protein SEH1-like isoform X2 n=1 Tax=Nelumbo nucifera TaxID=4432 RepID=A0A1U8AFV1_NELNU|nr:PREDICTED: protein SEH1-like isoform X2 [Nelumbo nucifera]